MSDQHHADCMGSAGRPQVRTPNLDRIAAGGVRFSSAFCNNPICAPSRCSMMTGLYPRTTGITGNEVHELDAPNPGTLPTVLRNLGYQTMLVGKAHMIRRWNNEGFETIRYCDLIDADDGDPMNVHYFRHLVKRGLGDAYDLGTRFEGQSGFALERFVSSIPLADNIETWTGDTAVEMLRSRDRARPFMMHLSFQRPHEPLCIPPECRDWYDPGALTLPPSACDFFERRFEGKPLFQRQYVTGGTKGYPYRPLSEGDLRGQLAYYYTLITLIDHQIGRVLELLAETGDLDNTVICYVADHGDFAGDHGLILKNLGIYESIHRVPFLLQWPGGPRGAVRDELVEMVDLYPTLLEAAGLSSEAPRHLEGVSRVDLARGEAGGAEAVVCEYDFGERQPYSLAVRTRRHRLVAYPWQAQEIGELYDRQDDPGELRNLWHSPSHRDVRLKLTELALSHVSRYRRRWSIGDDGELAKVDNSPRRLLQQRGVSWSSLHGKDD
jgi:arylsulfatase A-like enzyme